MITFKNAKIEREFMANGLRSDVRVIVIALAAHIEALHGIDIVVTSVDEEPGVKRKSRAHAKGRAVDVRTKDWPKDAAASAGDWVNSRFATGAYFKSGRPMRVAVYHDSGYGPHFHLQVAKGRPVQVMYAGGGETKEFTI